MILRVTIEHALPKIPEMGLGAQLIVTEIEIPKRAASDIIEPLTRANLRFTVGSSDLGYSSSWTAFGKGSDYYIGARPVMGSTKVSLHASRICRVGLTQQYYNALSADGLVQPKNRVWKEWTRLEAPSVGAIHVASIIFPTDYLKQPHQPKATPKKPMIVFEAAPAGQAVEIAFFYSREAMETLESKFASIGNPFYCTTLDNGEMVSVVMRVGDFEPTALPTQDIINSAARILLSKEAAQAGELNNLTGIFGNDPEKDGGALILTEIGGMGLRRTRTNI